MLNKEAQFNALHNAVNYLDIEGVCVLQSLSDDKRKTVPMFVIEEHGRRISPVMDYNTCQYFILGMIQAKKILTNNLLKNIS
jgi:hypothetical protein